MEKKVGTMENVCPDDLCMVSYPLVVLSVGGGEAVCPVSTISPCLDRDIPPGDSAAGGLRHSPYRG